MQRLVVLRHGAAERWRAGLADPDRELTEQGQRDAFAAGRWLGARGIRPDRVVASPAKRTRQTAHQACRAAGVTDDRLAFDERIYDADFATLEAVARDNEDVETLLLVGHQPGVGGLIVALTGRPDPPIVAPGAIAVLAAPAQEGEPWTLEALVQPEAFTERDPPAV